MYADRCLGIIHQFCLGDEIQLGEIHRREAVCRGDAMQQRGCRRIKPRLRVAVTGDQQAARQLRTPPQAAAHVSEHKLEDVHAGQERRPRRVGPQKTNAAGTIDAGRQQADAAFQPRRGQRLPPGCHAQGGPTGRRVIGQQDLAGVRQQVGGQARAADRKAQEVEPIDPRRVEADEHVVHHVLMLWQAVRHADGARAARLAEHRHLVDRGAGLGQHEAVQAGADAKSTVSNSK